MSQSPIQRSLEELIIISTTIIATLSVTPFAIYRYSNGQYLAALFEILGVLIMCAIGIYVWKTRNTRVMKVVLSVTMLTALVLINYVLSTSVLFWIYPMIMTVYFINSLKVSALLVTPAIVALLPILIQEKTTVEVVSIVVTLIICQLFGFLLSSKIQQHYSKMGELVNQDGLTGALNRRAFDERLDFLHSFSNRHNKKQEAIASLIIFDIDNFKAINDKFGHQEGDRILINLTKTFKQNMRDIDHLYRYGGEEFVVIANGADTLKAAVLAEKLRLLLETTDISDCTKVTASFGVAELQKREPTSRWVDRGDKAMYRAKRAGKNRVFIANFNKDLHHEDKDKLKISKS